MALAWCEFHGGERADPRAQSHFQALQRLQYKNDVIAEVIGGRLALREAGARFRALLDATTEEEDVCREVIGWVHLALRDRPEKADAFSYQLEMELERDLASQGEAHPSGRGQ